MPYDCLGVVRGTHLGQRSWYRTNTGRTHDRSRTEIRFCTPLLTPAGRPHMWGLMHRHITHNKCYASFKDFSIAMLNFLYKEAPENWGNWRDEVSDNFRIINPTNFRILT